MVYDLTQIFNELDLLEIRLNVLNDHVDFFVLGESTQTFSGKSKPLYYQENKERFAKWNHKIIHVVIPEMETDDIFERTAFQKDYLRIALKDCDLEDVIFYGDVDEMYCPLFLTPIEDKIYKLKQSNYCYYLNLRSSEEWQGTNVCKYKNLINLNEFRANHDNVKENGGWHFTNMGGIDQIRKKIEAYDHQEMITDEVREKLEERMENGQDYLGREFDWKGKPFFFYKSEIDLPQYLCYNKEQWKHLFR